MEQVVALIGVEISFEDGRVVIVLDKRIVLGTAVLFSERHRHEVLGTQTMPDGLDALESYLALNNWPDISAQDRATLLNVTNAARGTEDQGTFNPL